MRLFPTAILTLVISICAFGQTYTINTFAGGPPPLSIQGTAASLHYPHNVAVDSIGNLFFAAQYGVVLRMNATGVLARVGGNGTPGFSGDNGPALAAQLGAGGVE